VRGVFFANIGGGWFADQGFKFFNRSSQVYPTVSGYTSSGAAVAGQSISVSGFRLQDSRASYGLGLETFALGLPIHFDWSWRTLFNTSWEDVVFAADGGSAQFRRPRFAIWIGYDF
jgi:outer membrane protein assembly factor BamA